MTRLPQTRSKQGITRFSFQLMSLFMAATVSGGPIDAGQQRPITVEDCVRTRRFVDQEVAISPDGTRVAYVVKAPDLLTNHNDYRLYIRDLANQATRDDGQLVVHADGISGIRWVSSDAIMTRIESGPKNGKDFESRIEIVNARTGAREKLDCPGKIEEYSASADGNTLVFSVKTPGTDTPLAADLEQQKVRDARGYPVLFGEGVQGTAEHLPEDQIFLAKRTKAGKLEVRQLYFDEAGEPTHQSSLRDVHRLDLSPDGKHLLVTHSARSLPSGWVEEPYVQFTMGWGSLFDTYVLSLYDMETGRLSLGFNFSGFFLKTSWSEDSRSYSVVSPSPFGTQDGQTETQFAVQSGTFDYTRNVFEHVWAVDVETGTTTRVLHRENRNLWPDLPLFWKHSDGPMLVRADDTTFAWMAKQQGEWKETGRFDIAERGNFFSSLASDGRVLVGVSQTTMDPPNLFAVTLGTKERALLTDLNPEYREIQLGKVEKIEWTNRYGSKCRGFLIEPVDYQAGKRYPMVLLSAPPAEMFISDAQYTTAYAPQPLANAGFLVLVVQYPLDNKIPKGTFPGEMSEAYNWMAMVESAVDLLADRGTVDQDNVGISGFSRTSWLTDFTLTHSSYKFAAASSADSGVYIYGAYFEYNSRALMTALETEVGGPPYGDTFKNWLQYAPPFSADKVRTPVLMEYRDKAEPALEFFTALSRLGKAVDLFCYPNGSHPLDTPWERVASLQRNVDWFRFWMQGYEGGAPEYDPSQYPRWRALRSRPAATGVAPPPGLR